MERSLQYKRTDRDIREAFLRLIQTKSFEKITVQDILTEAMINRSTFYQHFADKYVLLEEIQRRYAEEFAEVLKNAGEVTNPVFEQMNTAIEQYFCKNRIVLKALLRIKTEHVDLRLLWQEYFMETFMEPAHLTALEKRILSGMAIDFFLFYLENEQMDGNFSSLFYESFLHIIVHFFRLEGYPQAEKELQELFGKYHVSQVR